MKGGQYQKGQLLSLWSDDCGGLQRKEVADQLAKLQEQISATKSKAKDKGWSEKKIANQLGDLEGRKKA